MAAPAALALALVLLAASRFPGPTAAMQVTLLNPYNVVILFQPVTLRCSYQTAATQPPIVTWKYKSYCRSRLADAFNPGGADSQLNSQLQQANPGYNPYVECQDSSRTVRVVATKQGNAVTLGEFYQGRRVTIVNAADLQLEQTAWGDSGVYYCTVTSAQDLEGNNEAFAELLVLGSSAPGAAELLPGLELGGLRDWLFVALVVLSAAALGLALGLCWCQCCPHRCCCFVRCPCCPRRCCCPEALYLAGKAATAGLPLSYGGAALTPVTLAPGALTPLGDGPRPGSAGGCSSQVPLLRDTDSVASSGQRSAGRRLQPGPGRRRCGCCSGSSANWPPSGPAPRRPPP
ncbi:lipolysis-stimulated lipoprotein receptor, partial [Struthio camelus]|uniref:lipolysis-stimulated lipoprotein receptor n=1 Tax=Struthio camelus TaxID=8801 RepID=UPI003603F0D5